MKPIGTILRKERKKLGISLKQASQKTKISLLFLRYLEKNQLQKLPREPYCSLFVKDYAQFLSLPSSKMVAICRRDLAESDRPTFTVSPSQLIFTPRLTVSFLILIALIFFTSYLFYQYRQFQKAPFLKVNWPSTESVTKKELEIRGSTDPENVLRINQKPIIIDSEGNFSTIIVLESGANPIRIEATSLNKKTTVEERIVGFTSTP